jgi:hypothetical protein
MIELSSASSKPKIHVQIRELAHTKSGQRSQADQYLRAKSAVLPGICEIY